MKLNNHTKNNLKYFIILLLLAGYAKIPSLGIPMITLMIIFTPYFIIKTFKKKIYANQIYILFLFIIYFIIRISIEPTSAIGDFSFAFTLAYKIVISILIAEVFFNLFEKKIKLLYLYVSIQLLLISASAYYTDIYNFLLLFQTNALNNTFLEIFGLRSLGFGVIHNEGAALLSLMYTFLIFKDKSGFWSILFSLFIYLLTFTSRMSMILIAISQFLLSPIRLIISLTGISILAVFFLDLSTGILSEAFEIYNNFLKTETVGLRSVEVMSEMPRFPDNIITWIIGDGKFLTNDGFYMGTDLGFSRILFSGGMIGLLLYLLVNIWPLFYINYKNKSNHFHILIFCITIHFIIINIKGINIQNWAFITLLLLSKTHHYKKC